jgi:hypothetical protein
MDEKLKKKILKIIDGIQCPKDFECYKSEFEHLCKIKDIGLDSFLECLDKEANGCTFSVYFGGTHYCRCPLRMYIYKELKK